MPRPGGTEEDDGWVIAGVHNAATLRADIVILDAKRWAGPWGPGRLQSSAVLHMQTETT